MVVLQVSEACSRKPAVTQHPTMSTPIVTAVGRRLRPKHGEPRLHQIVAVRPDGEGHVIYERRLKAET